MKRSGSINLTRMRKNPLAQLGLSLRVTLIGSGAALLAGCSSDEGEIYQTLSDCTLENPDAIAQCSSAYQQAKDEWARTAPRFPRLSDCEYEFGDDECESGQGYFLPLMAGYMLYRYGSDDLDIDFDRPKPLTSSSRRRSPLFGKWVGASGQVYGNYSQNRVKVSSSDFRPLKGGRRVLGRGGFGRTVVAASRSRGS